VQNGFVCNWTACAIRLEFNDESIVQNIHAHQNHAGICVGPRSVVTRCVVSESNYQGFVLQYGSVITNSTANNNSQEGFKCQPSGGGGACTITDCVAYENGSHGFFASEASSIEGCVAIRNQGDGINAGIASLVRGCTSRQNYGDGIEVYTESSVMDNNSVANGWTTSDGAGIHVTGFTNRIEGNNCAQNTRGLDVDMGSNVIIGNSVGTNTTNFDIVAGNTWSSATPDVAGPWDNLEY